MLPAWMKETDKSPPPTASAVRARKSFVSRTIAGLIGFFEGALASEGYARRPGFLQGLDPRVKLITALLLAVAVIRLTGDKALLTMTPPDRLANARATSTLARSPHLT